VIRDPSDGWEDAMKHNVDALAPGNGVDSVPYACAESTVEDWPVGAKDAE